MDMSLTTWLTRGKNTVKYSCKKDRENHNLGSVGPIVSVVQVKPATARLAHMTNLGPEDIRSLLV